MLAFTVNFSFSKTEKDDSQVYSRISCKAWPKFCLLLQAKRCFIREWNDLFYPLQWRIDQDLTRPGSTTTASSSTATRPRCPCLTSTTTAATTTSTTTASTADQKIGLTYEKRKLAFTFRQITRPKMVVFYWKKHFWPRIPRIMSHNTLCVNATLNHNFKVSAASINSNNNLLNGPFHPHLTLLQVRALMNKFKLFPLLTSLLLYLGEDLSVFTLH